MLTIPLLLGDLISNFIESLKLANLTPKRFMLQTGAKHYGFHVRLSSASLQDDATNDIGCFVDWTATSPSFESDAG